MLLPNCFPVEGQSDQEGNNTTLAAPENTSPSLGSLASPVRTDPATPASNIEHGYHLPVTVILL